MVRMVRPVRPMLIAFAFILIMIASFTSVSYATDVNDSKNATENNPAVITLDEQSNINLSQKKSVYYSFTAQRGGVYTFLVSNENDQETSEADEFINFSCNAYLDGTFYDSRYERRIGLGEKKIRLRLKKDCVVNICLEKAVKASLRISVDGIYPLKKHMTDDDYSEVFSTYYCYDCELTAQVGENRENVYNWYYKDEAGNRHDLAQTKARTYTIKAREYASPKTMYYCDVVCGNELLTIPFEITADSLVCDENFFNIPNEVDVKFNEKITLDATVESLSGTPEYSWYKVNRLSGVEELIPEENSSVYSFIAKDSMTSIYRCEITDGFQTASMKFEPKYKGIPLVKKGKSTDSAKKGKPFTLKVAPSGDTPLDKYTYVWYKACFDPDTVSYKGEPELLSDEKEPVLTGIVSEREAKYYCIVTKSGLSKVLEYTVDMSDADNPGVFTNMNGNYCYEACYGDNVRLNFEPSGKVAEYRWYFSPTDYSGYGETREYKLIEGADEAAFEFTASQETDGVYKVAVCDEMGWGTAEVRVYNYDYTNSFSDTYLYEYTPEKTGWYSASIEEGMDAVCVGFLDCDGNDTVWHTEDKSLYLLEKGKLYNVLIDRQYKYDSDYDSDYHSDYHSDGYGLGFFNDVSVKITLENRAELSLSAEKMNDAADLTVNTDQTIDITAGEEKVYSYEAPKDGTYILSTKATRNPEAAVYDQDGNLIIPAVEPSDWNELLSVSLSKGKIYYFVIWNDNDRGLSAKGTFRLSNADLVENFDPVTIKTVSNTSKGIQVTWTESKGAEGYYVYIWDPYDNDSGENWFRYKIPAGQTSFVYEPVIPMEEYSMKVCAYYDEFTTECDSVPVWRYVTATEKLSAKVISTGIKLSLDACHGDGYYVYRSKNGETYKKIATVKDYAQRNYTDKNVTNGARYKYKIVNFHKPYGEDEYKSCSSPVATAYYLTRPAAVSVTSSKAGKLNVKWKKNTKASGYQIRYSLSSSFKTYKTKNITSKSTVSKTLKSLKKGKKYYVKIRAYKKSGNKTYYSSWSTAKSIRVRK